MVGRPRAADKGKAAIMNQDRFLQIARLGKCGPTLYRNARPDPASMSMRCSSPTVAMPPESDRLLRCRETTLRARNGLLHCNIVAEREPLSAHAILRRRNRVVCPQCAVRHNICAGLDRNL